MESVPKTTPASTQQQRDPRVPHGVLRSLAALTTCGALGIGMWWTWIQKQSAQPTHVRPASVATTPSVAALLSSIREPTVSLQTQLRDLPVYRDGIRMTNELSGAPAGVDGDTCRSVLKTETLPINPVLNTLQEPPPSATDLVPRREAVADSASRPGARGLARRYQSEAIVLFRSRQWELAAGKFSLAIQLADDDISRYLSRAKALIHLQRWEEALVDLNHVVDRFPDWVPAQTARAFVVLHMGDLKESQRQYQYALDVLGAAADSELSLGGLEEELSSADLMWKLVTAKLGERYMSCGEYGRAVVQFTQLLARDGNGYVDAAKVYANRAACYIQLNKPLQALKDGREILGFPEIRAQCYGYYIRGFALQRLGWYERAVMELESAVDIDPNFKDGSATELLAACRQRIREDGLGGVSHRCAGNFILKEQRGRVGFLETSRDVNHSSHQAADSMLGELDHRDANFTLKRPDRHLLQKEPRQLRASRPGLARSSSAAALSSLR